MRGLGKGMKEFKDGKDGIDGSDNLGRDHSNTNKPL
jgi:sec-independent protein translocase protein TatA